VLVAVLTVSKSSEWMRKFNNDLFSNSNSFLSLSIYNLCVVRFFYCCCRPFSSIIMFFFHKLLCCFFLFPISNRASWKVKLKMGFVLSSLSNYHPLWK
jgi:uncharacterized protein YybS (DUF2232 family)